MDRYVCKSWSCKSTIFDFRKVSRCKRKIDKTLRDAISSENDEVARSCFMYELVHFKDHDSLPFIEFYFKNDMIDDGLITLEDVLDYYFEKV